MPMQATPAYGRDYKSKKEVLAAWAAGKDFIVQDIMDPWDGKPINLEDARNAGLKSINLRYKRLTQVVVVPIEV
jgi:hypothetical protein